MRAMAAQGSPGGRRRRPALVAIDGAGDASAREVTGPATADDREPDGTDAAGAEAGAAAGTVDAERLSDVDEWGRSHMRDLLAVLYEPIYERLRPMRLQKLPAGAVVANHAGAIRRRPRSCTDRAHPGPVHGATMFGRIPLVNVGWRFLGGVHPPDNAYRLLRRHLVVLLGRLGPGHWSERYKLRRSAGACADSRVGVPIIPAVIGSEEIMLIVAKLPTLARLLGLPYVPITANMLSGRWPPRPVPGQDAHPVPTIHLDVPPDQPRYRAARS